ARGKGQDLTLSYSLLIIEIAVYPVILKELKIKTFYLSVSLFLVIGFNFPLYKLVANCPQDCIS
ncbi:TPA: hypothetical protein JBA25_05665, partial [Legionella pneumophila]|nr:hypothetical protein [Legionella pneumophila]